MKKNILSLGLLLLSFGSIKCPEHVGSDDVSASARKDAFNREMQKAKDENERKLSVLETSYFHEVGRALNLHDEKIDEIHRKYDSEQPAARFVEGDGGMALESSSDLSKAGSDDAARKDAFNREMQKARDEKDRKLNMLKTSYFHEVGRTLNLHDERLDEIHRKYDSGQPAARFVEDDRGMALESSRDVSKATPESVSASAPVRSAMDDVSSAKDRLSAQEASQRTSQDTTTKSEQQLQREVDLLIQEVTSEIPMTSVEEKSEVDSKRRDRIVEKLQDNPELNEDFESEKGKKYLEKKLKDEKITMEQVKAKEKELKDSGLKVAAGISLFVVASLLLML